MEEQMAPPSKVSAVNSTEKAGTKFVELTGQDAHITYNENGIYTVPLDPETGWILDIKGYREVSIYISSQKSSQRTLHMGKISETQAAQIFPLHMDAHIHTFKVVGPEMGIQLNGPRDAQEQIKLWVYLTA